MKLTPKQKKFADEYIKSGNIEQSALEAGYSKNYARSGAHKLLANVSIESYIAERIEEIDKANIATQKEILEFVTRVMRRQELEETVNVLKRPTVIEVKGSGDDNTYEKVVNEEVAEITELKTSVGDALRAADMLAKLIKPSEGSESVESEKLRKITAEADIAEKKAELINGSTGEITVNIQPFEEDV
ncbi:terminase small subunit [Leuconostoc fallax]|uniref:terminase small subunit n=1 Tax=Leuconostoc fallax TaxID=1251 RepID=UPI001C1E9ECC|nr:terminase small subunit [Leuconostoc fallax]MBU7455855.1 terminase small subunit [Leuconostoc fallax]